MELTMENQYLRVEITSIGAELMSIYHKESDREYLWGGNPAVWPRRSPILFPNCGAVKNGSYTIDGKEYPAKQHGFARDVNHKVVCASEQIATFRLEQSEESLEIYPYKFSLKTTYKLEKSSVVCKHKVINYDDKPIYFSFGFHSGIRCPFVPGTTNTDYEIAFEKKEDCIRLQASSGGIISRDEQPYKPDVSTIPVTHGGFSGSLVLKQPTSKYIDIRERSTGDYVRFIGTDSPYTVIWSTPDDVQAICIEPWYGVADYEDFDGDITRKDGIICLAPMEEFVCQQIIEIGMGKK